MPSRYADLSRAQLARLVPELLLCGHLIDRSSMAWVLREFDRQGLIDIAIDEWAAASPIYTKRMQRALGFEGNDVTTIFKGIQFDIGSPPQFMDFRFRVESPTRGEFWLDHCGALLDVEPMGEEFVQGMCHDIEDPTFDATAIATNPRAQVRPVHRPPRVPAERHPHCQWTVTIDDAHPEAQQSPLLAQNAATRAAQVVLDPIDPADEGAPDYAGPLVSDVDFATFSRSALSRIADEVVLQQHLLFLAFQLSLRSRTPADDHDRRRALATNQLTGIAGLAAERIHRAMGFAATPEGAVQTLALHPVFNPAAYVSASFTGRTLCVDASAAHADGAWLAYCGPHSPEPLQAMVRAVDPHLDVQITGAESAWELTVVTRDEPAQEAAQVQITRFSGGASFAFQPRTSLPLASVR
jgi:hypothetical protein